MYKAPWWALRMKQWMFHSLTGLCCVDALVVVYLLSHVQWTVACQVPLSMGFSRQEYWSGLPCPYPGDFPDPGMEPTSVSCTGRWLLYLHCHLGSPKKQLLNWSKWKNVEAESGSGRNTDAVTSLCFLILWGWANLEMHFHVSDLQVSLRVEFLKMKKKSIFVRLKQPDGDTAQYVSRCSCLLVRRFGERGLANLRRILELATELKYFTHMWALLLDLTFAFQHYFLKQFSFRKD